MCATGDRGSYGSAARDPPAAGLQHISCERQEEKRKRKANFETVSEEVKRQAMTDSSNLLNVVRRPMSPDGWLEVSASRVEYEQEQRVLENDGRSHRYPKLWYDGNSNVAIVVAAPSAIDSGMAGGILQSISAEVMMHQGISQEIKRGLALETDTTSTRGLTTRGWDGALRYRPGNRSTLMIAVEVGVSQAYDISWSVCAMHCRRNTAFHDAEEDFRRQLTQSPYGPLHRDGVTWSGRVQQMIVQDGEFVGDNVPPSLHEVVLGDCIPSHILSGAEIIATPDSMVESAVNRMRRRAHFGTSPT
ncbi:hypothetical protein V1525DRAFT_449795 [Lipomyces kononenkoae]|uniref:Uncharacterized protein n=1 Tax=Lipomyces kononenkoae TaxID=34357 RepID=A0ACC3T395_LIPKO